MQRNEDEAVDLPPDLLELVERLRHKPEKKPPRELVLGNSPQGLGYAIAAMAQIRVLGEEQLLRDLNAHIARFEAFVRRWAGTTSPHSLAVRNRYIAADMRRWEAHRAGLPIEEGAAWLSEPWYDAQLRMITVRELRKTLLHERRAYRDARNRMRRGKAAWRYQKRVS